MYSTADYFPPRLIQKLLVAFVVVAAGAILYWQFGHELSLEALVQREQQLRVLQQERPVLVPLAAFAVYVIVAALSIPAATGLSVLYGWLFGFWRALLIVSFASTLGATLAFLLSRYLFRDVVQRRFGPHLARINEALQREGAYYLFTLRLIPYVPFWLVNLLMGLAPIRTRTFWWVSQLGMLPATCLWIGVGASMAGPAEIAETGVAGVLTPPLIISLTLLGLLPIMTRWSVKRLRAAFANRRRT